MTSNIHYVQQGSPEWKALRCGKLTGSRVHEALAKTKSGWSASRKHYLADLLCERLTGVPVEAFISFEMRQGREREPQARMEYQLRSRIDVTEIGFCDHPSIAMAGCSPDGFVGSDGVCEIKSPKSGTHLDFLRSGIVPKEYEEQCHWALACNPARQWCDFTSYNPDFPTHLQLATVRIERDTARISEMEEAIRAFLGEVAAEVESLQNRKALAA